MTTPLRTPPGPFGQSLGAVKDNCHDSAHATLRQQLADASKVPMCGTCGGVPPSSGLPCVCGGRNTIYAEIAGLRADAFESRRQLADAEAQRDLAKRLVSRLPLCQDHRDKFDPEHCQACRAERAEARERALEEGAHAVARGSGDGMMGDVHCWAGWLDSMSEEERIDEMARQWQADEAAGLDRGFRDRTCMLLAGHEGLHEWTPDDQIGVRFL
jgi:hypothetical protein